MRPVGARLLEELGGNNLLLLALLELAGHQEKAAHSVSALESFLSCAPKQKSVTSKPCHARISKVCKDYEMDLNAASQDSKRACIITAQAGRE